MKSILTICASLIFACAVSGQIVDPQVIATAGDFFQNSNGSISWTIGEPVTETFTDAGNNNILTQGFQQSRYDIVVVNSISKEIKIALFPNPASEFLNLEWDLADSKNVQIEINDALGRTLVQQSFSESKSAKQFNISGFPAAQYFVRILSDKKVLKTYKVTKH